MNQTEHLKKGHLKKANAKKRLVKIVHIHNLTINVLSLHTKMKIPTLVQRLL